MDRGVFKGARLCPALNTPLPVDGTRKLFSCDTEGFVQEVLFQRSVKTLSVEGEIFWYGCTSSSRGTLFPVGIHFVVVCPPTTVPS